MGSPNDRGLDTGGSRERPRIKATKGNENKNTNRIFNPIRKNNFQALPEGMPNEEEEEKKKRRKTMGE